jgi:hypothetical protein
LSQRLSAAPAPANRANGPISESRHRSSRPHPLLAVILPDVADYRAPLSEQAPTGKAPHPVQAQ